MINLKLTFHQAQTFMVIVGDMSDVLSDSKGLPLVLVRKTETTQEFISMESLLQLAGDVLHDLHTRLVQKTGRTWMGEKSIKLNQKECLALRQFLNYTAPQEGIFQHTLRMEIFETIDKKFV